ncbi:hypothetical protein H6768_00570 [Candidatus Peribacteria bacterium]|nr:hypothetical protein [Candidatus Peribacteria bacterium]
MSDSESSFQSNHPIRVVQNTYFFIDQDKQEITLLSRSPDIKKESLNVREVVTINDNGAYFIDTS